MNLNIMKTRKGVSVPINSTATLVAVIVFVAIIIAALSTTIFDLEDDFVNLIDSEMPDTASENLPPILVFSVFTRKFVPKIPLNTGRMKGVG